MGRLFTDDVLAEMGKNNERPIIMPMSNPVTNMECSHSRAQRFTGDPPLAAGAHRFPVSADPTWPAQVPARRSLAGQVPGIAHLC